MKGKDLLDDMCMFYRHDYGLLSKEEQDDLRFDAKKWAIALVKSLECLVHSMIATHERVCPRCNGYGFNTVCSWDGQSGEAHSESCPECNGTGKIKEDV